MHDRKEGVTPASQQGQKARGTEERNCRVYSHRGMRRRETESRFSRVTLCDESMIWLSRRLRMLHENVKPCFLSPCRNLFRDSWWRTRVCSDETRLSVVSPLEDHTVLVTSFTPLYEAVCAFLRMRETYASPGGCLPSRDERQRPGVHWE